MATPEASIFVKFAKIEPTLSVVGTLFSIGAGIYGAVDNKEQWEAVNRKLDQIITTQKLILDRLDAVYAEVQWQAIVKLLGEELKDIDNWFMRLKTLADNALKDPAYGKTEKSKKVIQDLVKDVNEKCADHLRTIDSVIMGRLGELSGPLMQIFADKIRYGGTKSPSRQSQYYDAVSYFERWLIIQQKALILLGNAFKYENPNATLEEVMKELRDYTHQTNNGQDSPIFQLQASYSRKYLESALEKYYAETNKEPREGIDFIAFGISTDDHYDVFELDTNPIEADAGQIVVGLQLYGKGKRLALKIIEAPFSRGRMQLPFNHYATKENSEFNEHAFQLIKRKGRQTVMYQYQHQEPPPSCYLDISRTEAPKGEIMTGAQLYMKGNRIAIRIQSAKLDQFKNVVESSRHWTDSPPNGNQEGTDFVVLRNRAKYVNIHPIIPKPLAPIRGASLFLHDDGGGYRVNVSLKTGLCDIEDVWQQYDLPTIAERLGGNSSLSSQVYSDMVYLQCSDNKYVDSHCWVGSLPSELELVQLGPNKIGFRVQLNHANALWHIYNESKDGGMYGTYISGNPRPDWAIEWVEAENGTIALKAFNGKYIGRKFVGSTDSMLVANQDRIETAEKFRIIPKFK